MFGVRRIKIDKVLYDRLRDSAEKSGYASPEELIVHLLQREVARFDEQQDEQLAEEQLRGLGYLE